MTTLLTIFNCLYKENDKKNDKKNISHLDKKTNCHAMKSCHNDKYFPSKTSRTVVHLTRIFYMAWQCKKAQLYCLSVVDKNFACHTDKNNWMVGQGI